MNNEKVKLERNWGSYKKGEIIECDPQRAEALRDLESKSKAKGSSTRGVIPSFTRGSFVEGVENG